MGILSHMNWINKDSKCQKEVGYKQQKCSKIATLMIGNERQPLISGRDRVEAESNLGAEPLNDEQEKRNDEQERNDGISIKVYYTFNMSS